MIVIYLDYILIVHWLIKHMLIVLGIDMAAEYRAPANEGIERDEAGQQDQDDRQPLEAGKPIGSKNAHEDNRGDFGDECRTAACRYAVFDLLPIVADLEIRAENCHQHA